MDNKKLIAEIIDLLSRLKDLNLDESEKTLLKLKLERLLTEIKKEV